MTNPYGITQIDVNPSSSQIDVAYFDAVFADWEKFPIRLGDSYVIDSAYVDAIFGEWSDEDR